MQKIQIFHNTNIKNKEMLKLILNKVITNNNCILKLNIIKVFENNQTLEKLEDKLVNKKLFEESLLINALINYSNDPNDSLFIVN